MRYAKTEWGVKVKTFQMRYGITLKYMAAQSGVSYNTLSTMLVGKTTGEKSGALEKMNAFMEEYAANNDPVTRMAVQAYEGL